MNTQGAAIEPLVYSHPNEGVVFTHPIEPLFRQSEANQGVEQREKGRKIRLVPSLGEGCKDESLKKGRTDKGKFLFPLPREFEKLGNF